MRVLVRVIVIVFAKIECEYDGEQVHEHAINNEPSPYFPNQPTCTPNTGPRSYCTVSK